MVRIGRLILRRASSLIARQWAVASRWWTSARRRATLVLLVRISLILLRRSTIATRVLMMIARRRWSTVGRRASWLLRRVALITTLVVSLVLIVLLGRVSAWILLIVHT